MCTTQQNKGMGGKKLCRPRRQPWWTKGGVVVWKEEEEEEEEEEDKEEEIEKIKRRWSGNVREWGMRVTWWPFSLISQSSPNGALSSSFSFKGFALLLHWFSNFPSFLFLCKVISSSWPNELSLRAQVTQIVFILFYFILLFFFFFSFFSHSSFFHVFLFFTSFFRFLFFLSFVFFSRFLSLFLGCSSKYHTLTNVRKHTYTMLSSQGYTTNVASLMSLTSCILCFQNCS